MNKGKIFVNKSVLFVFAVIILIADVLLIFDHKKTFSERENRVLQQAPALTLDSVASGKFMTKAENFVSDQFFLRDGWITYKYSVDILMGKKDVNGVWIGKNGYLIENTPGIDTEKLNENLEAIIAFATIHEMNTVVSIIPNASYVCSELLPNGAPIRKQEEILGDIQDKLSNNPLKYVDVTAALMEHKNEYLYYKSDHHWTSLGAKYGFEALGQALGLTEISKNYDIYTVTNDFSGTLASATGAPGIKDEIEIYAPQGTPDYVVEYVGEGVKTATVYSSMALETVSKYDVFLGGNHSLVKIKSGLKNGKNLLVIKDSYANAFIQFLVPYYESIYIVDPRYFSDRLTSVMEEGKITEVLFLYNLNTFIEDNSLAGVLLEK